MGVRPGRPATSTVLVLALFTLSIFLVSCGGDEDSQPTQFAGDSATRGSPGDTTSNGPNVSSDTPASPGTSTPVPVPTGTPTPVPPRFAGYDLELSEGDFWRFRWEFFDRSCAQGSGCKTTEDDGVFQVTLGPPREWKGATVFFAGYTGRSDYNDDGVTRSFKLKWTFIGVKDDRIVATNASGDSPLVTLFDARTGKWAGSGFFTDRFPDDELVEATAGQLTGSHEFASWPGVETGPWHFVRAAASQGKCETIEGRRICPREESFNYTETEYYRPDIGPFAYQYSFTASFSGGGFTTSYQTQERVALIASSFTGDDRGFELEGTPTASELSTPTPAPVVLAGPIFGPVDGGLELTPGSVDIPDFSSGLNIDSGMVQVTFENPDVPGNKWSHGITFRQSGEETFHAVFITSDGVWGHFARGGSTDSEVTPAVGQFEFDTRTGSQNLLTVVFSDLEGALFINGQKVAELDLSFAPALAAGDVRVMSGLFPDDELTGATTNFTDFVVYDLQ